VNIPYPHCVAHGAVLLLA